MFAGGPAGPPRATIVTSTNPLTPWAEPVTRTTPLGVNGGTLKVEIARPLESVVAVIGSVVALALSSVKRTDTPGIELLCSSRTVAVIVDVPPVIPLIVVGFAVNTMVVTFGAGAGVIVTSTITVQPRLSRISRVSGATPMGGVATMKVTMPFC